MSKKQNRNTRCVMCRKKTDGHKYCYSCGQKANLPEVVEWKCTNCGYRHNLHDYDPVCYRCGAEKNAKRR
jgi:hypothetical protein